MNCCRYRKRWWMALGGVVTLVLGAGLFVGCQGEPKGEPSWVQPGVAKSSSQQSQPTAVSPEAEGKQAAWDASKPTAESQEKAFPSQGPTSEPTKTTAQQPPATAPPLLSQQPASSALEQKPSPTDKTTQQQPSEEEPENPFDPKVIEQRRKMIEEEMQRLEAEWREKQKKRIAELGPPLVENVDKLIRLHPVFPVWADRNNKRIIMVGEVCKREGLLEMFACPRRTKEHESIVVVDTTAQIVHAGLLAVGAEPGRPVQYHPTYKAASGDEIEVAVVWKDKSGKVQTARAQDWIRHAGSKKPMEHPWVFAGSVFAKSEETGEVSYMADGGDFICVSNFPTAMLDLPVPSSSVNAELEFEAFTERIPPEGTPVTLILTPKKKTGKEPTPEKPVQPQAEPPPPKPQTAEPQPKPAES